MGLWKVKSRGLCAYCNLYSAFANGGRVFEWLSASQKYVCYREQVIQM